MGGNGGRRVVNDRGCEWWVEGMVGGRDGG